MTRNTATDAQPGNDAVAPIETASPLPRDGGSYRRRPDGSLEQLSPTTAPPASPQRRSRRESTRPSVTP